MRRFLSTLLRNLLGCFKGWMILWHIASIILTFLLVASGCDGFYFHSTRDPGLRSCMFPAVVIGGLLPIVLPFGLLVAGTLSKRARITLAAWAVGQAELIGALVAAAYKSVTGRAHPLSAGGADLSHVFRFGFLRGGVFWGWPSSHTTIAFAMAATIVALVPKHRWLGCAAMAYAFYVGIGVSMTIHWLSDFAAGAIIGTVIGTVVGKLLLAWRNVITRASTGFFSQGFFAWRELSTHPGDESGHLPPTHERVLRLSRVAGQP